MNNYKNARLTPHGRALVIRRVLNHGLRPEEAAQAMGVSSRTAYKWLRRFREEGPARLENRSFRPYESPHAATAGQRAVLINGGDNAKAIGKSPRRSAWDRARWEGLCKSWG